MEAIVMPQSDDRHQEQSILTHIYEGMKVFDPEGETIGTVQHVYLGAVTPEEDARGQGPATAPDPGESESSLIEDFVHSLAPQDRLSNLVQQRFLRHGFIRINTTGFMNSGCYATPEQIERVSGDDVTLNVPREKLIKR
jgi:hypothetical protein